jgi:hypothetical protein
MKQFSINGGWREVVKTELSLSVVTRTNRDRLPHVHELDAAWPG